MNGVNGKNQGSRKRYCRFFKQAAKQKKNIFMSNLAM